MVRRMSLTERLESEPHVCIIAFPSNINRLTNSMDWFDQPRFSIAVRIQSLIQQYLFL